MPKDILMKEQKWITQKSLADELKVSIQRVCNWVARKNIKSKEDRLTGRKLVDRNSLSVRSYEIN